VSRTLDRALTVLPLLRRARRASRREPFAHRPLLPRTAEVVTAELSGAAPAHPTPATKGATP
jgi:hypothetical protein